MRLIFNIIHFYTFCNHCERYLCSFFLPFIDCQSVDIYKTSCGLKVSNPVKINIVARFSNLEAMVAAKIHKTFNRTYMYLRPFYVSHIL